MRAGFQRTISGTRIAASTAAIASASRRARLILRRSPSYSSTGIWLVSQTRQHDSHRQASPYGTSRLSPQSQETVIGGLRIYIRLYGDPRIAVRSVMRARGGLQ